MIEEEAWVTSVETGRVWIEKQRRSACSSCKETCASSLTAGLFSAKAARIPVHTSLSLNVGDRVLVGLREEALVLGSVRIYFLPLLALLAGALLGKMSGASDGGVALTGLSALGLSFLGLKVFGLFDRVDLQPVILHKII